MTRPPSKPRSSVSETIRMAGQDVDLENRGTPRYRKTETIVSQRLRHKNAVGIGILEPVHRSTKLLKVS